MPIAAPAGLPRGACGSGPRRGPDRGPRGVQRPAMDCSLCPVGPSRGPPALARPHGCRRRPSPRPRGGFAPRDSLQRIAADQAVVDCPPLCRPFLCPAKDAPNDVADHCLVIPPVRDAEMVLARRTAATGSVNHLHALARRVTRCLTRRTSTASTGARLRPSVGPPRPRSPSPFCTAPPRHA